jgi:DNA-binding SARP family transcriptional activator
MDDLAFQAAIQQLQGLSDDARILIAHPNFAGQHRILPELLKAQPTAYVRFAGNELTYGQLQEQLDTALQSQLDKGQLRGVSFLILDESDRADPAELGRLLEELVVKVGKGRIVLFTRVVPYYIYRNPSLRRQSYFIPAVPDLMLVDYAQQSPDKALLEVCALGSGRVTLNGRLVDNWDGTLPRALFFYLIDRGMTTRSQIFETFWPNLTSREATNVFHVTKRKISEVLGVDLTVYWSGFYHISSEIQLSYDAVLFSEMLTNSAVAPTDRAIDLFTYAISLYQGNFLTSMDVPWVIKRRDELLLSYGEALATLARVLEQNSEKEHALGLYIRASTTNPQREDIARNIMSLYAGMGKVADADATYERLETELDKSLNVAPAKETQELIKRIRSGATPV